MSYHNRYSDAGRAGKRDGERASSDFDYRREDYDRHGSEAQRDYAGQFDEAREDKRCEERRQEEREAEEREQQRHEEEMQRQRHEQEQYEQRQRQYEEEQEQENQ